MTPSDWAVFLPSLVGIIALVTIALEPDDGNGPDLDDTLALFTTLPWV